VVQSNAMVSQSNDAAVYGVLEFRSTKRVLTIANGDLEQLSKLQEYLKELDRQLRQPSQHSSGDWDFKNTSWTLDSAIYVSSPSSLHFTAYTNNTKVKVAAVPIASVKEGRIVTWVLSSAADGRAIDIVFRYQDDDNYYYVRLSVNANGAPQLISRYKDGVSTDLKSATKTLYADTWYKFRITWWNSYVGLVVRVEKWSGTAWETYIDDAYDSDNLWETIGGRIGFGSFHTSINANYYWIDDTEIYGIA
jgi:hypothetical protein